MKAKLIKKEDDFYSLRVDGIVMATSNGMLVDYKLSKENCDEIFGVVDVDDLASYFAYNQSTEDSTEEFAKFAFIEGFNKAIELNKDKLFTVEDIRKAIAFGWDYEGLTKEEMLERYNFKLEYDNSYAEDTDKFIQSLQQPTEIEVEILMGTLCRQIDCVDDARLVESKIVWGKEDPMLDENGCLILKKL